MPVPVDRGGFGTWRLFVLVDVNLPTRKKTMNTLLRPKWLYSWLVGVLILWIAFLNGCGKADNQPILRGKITYNREPLGGGTLTLIPMDGKNRSVSVPIGTDGTYIVASPPQGEMKVTIETQSVQMMSGGGDFKIPAGKGPPPQAQIKQPDIDKSKLPHFVAIPSKYADPKLTPLRITIEKGKNNKDFDLEN
jgi:hypothetical protein